MNIAEKPSIKSQIIVKHFFNSAVCCQNVPAVAEVPSPALRGYLWRLSTKRMVYTHDWKRRYFVLSGDKLYYYDK